MFDTIKAIFFTILAVIGIGITVIVIPFIWMFLSFIVFVLILYHMIKYMITTKTLDD